MNLGNRKHTRGCWGWKAEPVVGDGNYEGCREDLGAHILISGVAQVYTCHNIALYTVSMCSLLYL